jgi:hypothetical protein
MDFRKDGRNKSMITLFDMPESDDAELVNPVVETDA